MSTHYDPNVIRPLAGLSATQTTTAERLGLPAEELARLSTELSENFSQLLGSVIVRYDEAVGELALYR